MVTPAQQSSSAIAPLMLMKKWTSSPSIASYPPLFVACRNIVLLIGGNMNAQICKNVNNKISLHNSSNRNGKHLSDFMQRINLHSSILNFLKKGKVWTYTFANNAKSLIDYIFMNKKWNNSASI